MSDQNPAYYDLNDTCGLKEPLPLSIFLVLPFLVGMISVSALQGFNYLVIGLGAVCTAVFLLASIREGFFVPAELKFFMGFFCWSILGVFGAKVPPMVIEKLRTLAQLLVMALIVSYYARNTRCVSWLFWAVLAGVLIISVAAVVTGDFARSEVEGEEARLSGLAMNANSFGISVTYGVAILLYFFRALKSKILKAVIIGALLVAIRFVIASGSRKSILGLGLLIVCWFVFSYGKELRRRPMLVLVMLTGMVALGFYIAYELRDTVLMRRLLHLEAEAEGGGLRMTMIKEGIRLTLAHPILGLGLNNFRFYSVTGLYSHNNFVEVFSGVGIPGGILYFMIYAIIFWRLHKVGKMNLMPNARNVIIIFKCLMLLLLFLDIGVVSYTLKNTWIVLAIIIGYTYRMQKQTESQLYTQYGSSQIIGGDISYQSEQVADNYTADHEDSDAY